jgi:hypothetical protein
MMTAEPPGRYFRHTEIMDDRNSDALRLQYFDNVSTVTELKRRDGGMRGESLGRGPGRAARIRLTPSRR